MCYPTFSSWGSGGAVSLPAGSGASLDHKTNIGNEFLGSIMYRKVVSYMTYDLVVDKLNFLLISSFSTLTS